MRRAVIALGSNLGQREEHLERALSALDALAGTKVRAVSSLYETALGRVRSFRNAPRTIDLALLVMEGEESSDPELFLPHPRMGERGFVLAPLRDLFPAGKIFGWDFAEEMRTVSYFGVSRVENANFKKIFEKFRKRG